MRGIGNYIHSTWANYQEYGIGSPEEKKQPSLKQWSSQHEAIKEQLKRQGSKISQHDLNTIQEFIKGIKTSTINTDANLAEVQQVIMNRLNSQFGPGFSEKVNMQLLRVNEDKPSLGVELAKVKTKGGVKTRKFINPIKVAQTINALENAFAKQALPESTMDMTQFMLAKNQIQKIKKQYEDYYNTTINTMLQEGYTIPQKYATKKNAAQVLEMRKGLNEIINMWAKIEPFALEEGTIFENVLAAAAVSAKQTGEKVTEDMLEELVKGDRQTWKQQKVSTVWGDEAFQKRLGKDVLMSIQSSAEGQARRKTDVQIVWNGQKVNFSAKSVEIKEGSYNFINVVDETPLLDNLMYFNDHYVNHYLNHAVTHTDKNPSDPAIIKDMKMSLFYLGLTGRGTDDTIDIMAVHNKVSGDVKLVPVSKIIDKLNAQNITVRFNKVNVIKYRFQNNSNKNDKARIAQIITEIHRLKMSAGFRAASIYSIK